MCHYPSSAMAVLYTAGIRFALLRGLACLDTLRKKLRIIGIICNSNGGIMNLDNDRIDQAVLALIYLGLHDGARAWKGFDWQAMNRLHEQGYITDPRGKAKSVVFTEEGFERAKRLLEELFGKDAEDRGRR